MTSERLLAPSARPFLAYDLGPLEQPARRPAPREAYRDACAFVERWCKQFGGRYDNLRVNVVEAWQRPDERLAAARRQATARFGPPTDSPEMDGALAHGMPQWWVWDMPLSRIEAALEWLEKFADRAVPGPQGYWDQSVSVTCLCAFWFRDQMSGKLLPRQHSVYKAPVFWHSQISVILQATSLIALKFVLPFEEPDEDARQYLRALRPHLPVTLDPNYLFHFVPRADLTRYERRKLPLDWLD